MFGKFNGLAGLQSPAKDIDGIVKGLGTIADFKAMVDLPKKVHVSGYHEKDSGEFGSNFFILRDGVVPNGSYDNSGTTIETVNGVYDLAFDGVGRVEWFGAKEDGISDDSLAFKKASILGSVDISDKHLYLKSTLELNNVNVICSVNTVVEIVGDIQGLKIGENVQWDNGNILTYNNIDINNTLVLIYSNTRNDINTVFKPKSIKANSGSSSELLKIKAEVESDIVGLTVDIEYIKYGKNGVVLETTGGGNVSYINSNNIKIGFARFVANPFIVLNGVSGCEVSGNVIDVTAQTFSGSESYFLANGANNDYTLFVWDSVETNKDFINLVYGNTTVPNKSNIFKTNVKSSSSILKSISTFSATNTVISFGDNDKIINNVNILPNAGFNSYLQSPFDDILLHADKHSEKFTITKTNMGWGANTLFNPSSDYGKFNGNADNPTSSIQIDFTTPLYLQNLGFTTGFIYGDNFPTEIKLYKTLADGTTIIETISGDDNLQVWQSGLCVFSSIYYKEKLNSIKIEFTSPINGAAICKFFATQSSYYAQPLDLDFRLKKDNTFDNNVSPINLLNIPTTNQGVGTVYWNNGVLTQGS